VKVQPASIAKRRSPLNSGIELGDGIRFDPESLPNGHIVAIGASGSGKTQTLKAIAWEIYHTYPTQVILIDFHGDQELPGETHYPLHMASPHGINPLLINLDPAGGGPSLQAIAVSSTLKKALQMGANQEGLLLTVLEECYKKRGITQESRASWTGNPPTFADLEAELSSRDEDGCKESRKLLLKLAATFQYGVFSRPQPLLTDKLIRVDLSKLPPEIQAIAAESLASQLMNAHRLRGETSSKLPSTYLFVDEAKELRGSKACDRIIADGRKYGLALVMASQSERHLSADVIGNSSTKIVLPVDQTEVGKVARKFRFSEAWIAQLQPLEALVRMGKDGHFVKIAPYWQRI
jgi:type IV secretory pathway VirB4 component